MGKIEGKPCCRAIVRHGMAYGPNGKQKGMGNKREWETKGNGKQKGMGMGRDGMASWSTRCSRMDGREKHIVRDCFAQ